MKTIALNMAELEAINMDLLKARDLCVSASLVAEMCEEANEIHTGICTLADLAVLTIREIEETLAKIERKQKPEESN